MANSSILTAFERMWYHVIAALGTKSDILHNHNDMYYTESEINTKLEEKSDKTHNHDTAYDASGAANKALTSAQTYTDDAIANEAAARDSAIGAAKNSAISTASSDATTKVNNALDSAKSYTDAAVATAKNDLLNGAGEAYDTLKELGDLIDENVDAIEALETVATGKQNTITGAATTIASTDLAASRVLVSSSSGKVAVSAVTSTELGYLDGVTSDIQTQLNNIVKVPAVSSSDNGKFLRVVSGAWVAETVPNAEEAKF